MKNPEIISSYHIVESAIDSSKDGLKSTWGRDARKFRERYPFPDYLITYEGIVAHKKS